jgi:diguanylate cyclase (GGDEF)-like protein
MLNTITKTRDETAPDWSALLRPRKLHDEDGLAVLAGTLGDLLAARRPCAVLVFHIDSLADIVAQYGDGIGRELTDQFAAQVRRAEPLARCLAGLPGNRFALLISGQHVHADAETVALRVMRGLDSPAMSAIAGMRISASIGIALAPRHARDAAGLLQAALAALDDARQAGGDTWRMSNAVPAPHAAMQAENDAAGMHRVGQLPQIPMPRREGADAALRSAVLHSAAAARRRSDLARRRIRYAATCLVVVIAAAGFLRGQASGTPAPTHATSARP